MTYYQTLREDIERAKQVLATAHVTDPDSAVAHELLEKFVDAIETVGVGVIQTALRAVAYGRGDRLDRD